MVTLIEVIILSIIQGLTEWLPVSSSGHLVFTERILGLNLPLIFNVILHFGTLIVILTVYRKDILNIIKALVNRDFKTEEGKFALFLIIGSIPIAIIGFFLNNLIESLFSNLFNVGIALVITGCIIFFSEKRSGTKKIGVLDSLLIGLVQGIAIIPGISRSGVTISAGLLRRIDKETAFKYSFLLSVPAVLGATIIESKDIIFGTMNPILLIIGLIISMITGFGSLKLLKKMVIMEKIHLFAYYCWVFGLIIILLILF
ncbi:undecaprenyl-diphosphate phosphatase [Candidatus Bathyarchaeota archaeon]|nr:undecaprenyl-diphosphate phosphatase [Candidatus Bathyarchaeota archaeon]